MPTPDRQPFEWPRRSGCLTARVLEDFAEWCAPMLRVEWESPHVERAPRDSDEREERRPWAFRKNKGWLNLRRDLLPFLEWLLQAREIQPQAARHAYQPPRRHGPALITDLEAFHDHLLFLLKKKREERG